MAQDKGKALAGWFYERSPDTAEGTFVGRVGSSAAGLLRSAVLQPSAAQATSRLASSSFTSEKSQSSSSHMGFDMSATHSSNLGTRSSLSNSSGESFRSAQYIFENVKSNIEAEFDAFGQTSQVGRIGSGSATEMKIKPYDESTYRISSKITVSNPAQPKSCYSSADEWKSAEHDGGPVIALLSDPNWDLEDLDTNSGILEELSDLKTMFGIPSGIEEALDRTKLELPPPPSYKVPSPMNPLNLRPDFTSDCEKPVGDGILVTPTMTPRYGEKSYMYMMINEPVGVQELEPWLDVLTNYQDEVWGDLASVVKEVKDEIRNAKANKLDVIDPTAVRRLGMILGHLKVTATFTAQNS